MATESPIRIIEAGGKWASRNDMKSFWEPSTDMGIEDLGLILHGQILKGQNSNLPPNRSGSAPPSIEGAFAAIENLMFRKKFNATDSNISGAEEQLRADPLTPRLPPPLISGENRNLFWNVRGTGNNRRLSSFDDTFSSLLWSDHCNLSTHKEESDDDRSPKQEDLSEAQSPASTQSRVFGHETNDESNPTSTNVSNSSSIDGIRSNMAIESQVNKSLNDLPKDEVSISSAADGDVAAIRDEIASLSVSNSPMSDSGINQINWQQRNPFQVHATRPQFFSLPQTYVGMNQFLQNPINFSSEVQPTPHYASGTHLYSNMMPTGYFPQQYTIGGYPFNPPHVSPYATGYPLNNLFPTPFSNAFSGQSQTPGVNLDHFNNFYGHFGVPFSGEQNRQSLGALSHINLNSRRVGTTSPYYFGNPANVGFSQFPTSPLASSVIPESPMSGSSHRGRRNEGVYGGWKGNSGNHVINDPKMFSFLEELKSGKGRMLELSDIYGHIVEFSVDQHGSRFIQQKLEVCTNEEKESVFKEVIPHALRLVTDVFGNYVIQKFFEYGSVEQRRELGNQLEGQILPLSLQMYGCRVIQKALDTIELEQRTKLVRELDGNVLKCVRDQNGNHVIQKCIENIPTENIKFVISSFHGQVAALSKHPYGCRVIQRVLERCTDELHSQFIVNEILDSVFDLAQDQYGNYVTQYVLEGGKPKERSQIVQKLAGHIVQLSQHKFASNVIEKCLEHCDSASRKMIIEEIMRYADGNDNLMVMVKDQFANYVVQRVLQTCSGQQREILLDRIKGHLNSLKKYTYGKHIVARFEQLYGEEIETSRS